jgi:cbb3-type cytochrome oxidase maturation protein
MDVLYLLVPLSVALVLAIGAIFWFALRSGQFDDLERPGFEILLDDDAPAAPGGRGAAPGRARREAARDDPAGGAPIEER